MGSSKNVPTISPAPENMRVKVGRRHLAYEVQKLALKYGVWTAWTHLAHLGDLAVSLELTKEPEHVSTWPSERRKDRNWRAVQAILRGIHRTGILLLGWGGGREWKGS
jgi:hypothetical protein